MPTSVPGQPKPVPAVPARDGGVASTEAERLRREREHDIDEELEQSFPASDPPSWTMGVARVDVPASGPDTTRSTTAGESPPGNVH